jgi:FkbM family methyltransferase
MSGEFTGSEAFGARKPGSFWQLLVSICHQADASFFRGFCAPIVRKIIVNRRSMLPVDLTLRDFNLRCQFTDNYSEKKFVFTPWRYDKAERELLTRQLSNGGTFVDIGANVGLYTLTAAKALQGREGRIVAIEPNPATLARLKMNLSANPQLFGSNIRIDILDVGVADRNTTFDLSVDQNNLGASSIALINRSKSGRKANSVVSIRCRPLIDILTDLNIKRIDALKIDIEGAEDMALAPYLENAPPGLLAKTIFIENSEHLWAENLFDKMESRGYRQVMRSRMNSVFSLGGSDPGK